MRDPGVDQEQEHNADQAEDTDETDEAAGDSAIENGQAETVSMETELEAERQRSAEYLDQAQRARAELVNYRRRTEEELARMQKQAGERIISRLLPAIDDLDRAIDAMSEAERNSSWGEGIQLVQRKIWSTLESEGVSAIESLGKPFDPSLHEAISMQEGTNGTTVVVEEYQRGFMLGDRVLRPAMVVVGPEQHDTSATDKNPTNDISE